MCLSGLRECNSELTDIFTMPCSYCSTYLTLQEELDLFILIFEFSIIRFPPREPLHAVG